MTRFIRFDNLWADGIDYMKGMLRVNQRNQINEIDEIISCLCIGEIDETNVVLQDLTPILSSKTD